ncbi:hypothetical protein R1sor_009417 [Riccia sorocarpa]|uniref:Uncharacterized protein n=1 Tax=Riccia sorocarpa TaxID=122646 RepID=A0ABD3HWL7_9MARC
MEITPTRVQVIEWAEVRLKQHLGLDIIQIRALSRKHFLISLASEEQKMTALSAKDPFYMFRKMVFLSPWSHDFNPTKIYANILPAEEQEKGAAENVPEDQDKGKEAAGGSSKRNNAAESAPSSGSSGKTGKLDKEGFQLVSRKKNRRGQIKITILDKGGQNKPSLSSHLKFKDPNSRAYRRASGIFSDESNENGSSEDFEEDLEAASDGEDSMEEDTETQDTGNNNSANPMMEGNISDIASQDIPTLSQLHRDMKNQTSEVQVEES